MHPHLIQHHRAQSFVSSLLALVALAACQHDTQPVTPTVAQIERVRAGIELTEPGHPPEHLDQTRRLLPDALARTDSTGRALVVLDHGERLLLDHDTRLRVTDARHATLEAGRVWITSTGEPDPLSGESTLLTVGDATLRLRGVRASIERTSQSRAAVVDVMGGEVAFEAASRRGAVRAGEHAVLSAAGAEVSPRPLYDDWTGGLADDIPLGSAGSSALGAVAARRPEEQGAPRWPLVLQRLDAHVTLLGDLAITDLEQSFFNPAGDTVEGLYTLSVPRGAVLHRFAVDRRGTLVNGFVRERQAAAADYQAQVYQGSTHDPALLEWDAPGRYHARLYPIAPGATRRIVVTFTQWLDRSQDGGRSYRLPLSALGARIGELRVDVDVSKARASDIRASAGARREEDHIRISQSDVNPRADLVVDLRGSAPQDASCVRIDGPPAANDSEDRHGFVRVSVRAPDPEARDARDEGIDLVMVIDHSAATDPVAIQLEQSFAEAITRSLTARDKFLILAGDVSTRPQGTRTHELVSATPEARRAALDALATDRRGGATDLGAMIQAAHAALDPQRNGAIVYVGDGQATVGEGDLPALRARLNRLNPHPRLYAIAVGESPRLDLLAGLTEPSGFSARIARRGDIARTAIDLLAHAARPLVRDFSVNLGPNVERVYPSGPVDLPAGEPLVVVGRSIGPAPDSVRVRATWHGREIARTLRLAHDTGADGGDLRYRWASARLNQLLAQGEPRAVIVDLGTRYGLITPFTSLYVPSEDEPLPPGSPRRSDARDSLSVFDLLPLVGCSLSRSSPGEPPEGPLSGLLGEHSASNPSASAPASQSAPTGTPTTTVNNTTVNTAPATERPSRAMRSHAPRPPSADPSRPSEPSVQAVPSMMPVVAAPPPAPEAAGAPASRPSFARSRRQVPSGATLEETPVDQPSRQPQNGAENIGAGGSAPGAGGYLGHGSGGQGGNERVLTQRGASREIGRFGREGQNNDEGLRDRVADGSDLGGDDITTVNRNSDTAGWNDSGPGGQRLAQPSASAAARTLSRCSDAAAVSLGERVPLWRERLSRTGALSVWSGARRACELPAWTDKVALLRLMFSDASSLDGQLALYRGLRGDSSASTWLRDAILRRMARAGELTRASELGLSRLDNATLTLALAQASTPEARLNVLRSLTRRFPDDLDLALLLLDAAAAAHDVTEVRRTASRVREDPRTDARARTAAGEALLAIGDEAEARRAFSEIVEFAPDDPFARRRLGDIALSHGWSDEAYRQYQTLAAQQNDAPDIVLREAMAARGAGRFDEAVRLAERVTNQNAPGMGAGVSEAAAAWIAIELAIAGTEANIAADTLAALRARWRRSPAARNAGAVRVLLRWEHPDDGAELWLSLPGETSHRADVVASTVPIETTVLAEAPEHLGIEIRRSGATRPRGSAEIVVIWNEGTARERVQRQRVSFDPDHPRFLLDATPAALSALPTPPATVEVLR